MQKFLKSSKNKKNSRVEWEKASDVKKDIRKIVTHLDLDWIKTSKIYCFRSNNSKSRAYARIWGLSRVWQKALDQKPAYIIEVLSEKYDKLNNNQKEKVLIHELAHIPKNFSGSLVPHYRKGKRKFHDRVRTLVAQYDRVRNSK